jgi:hypothetical protein
MALLQVDHFSELKPGFLYYKDEEGTLEYGIYKYKKMDENGSEIVFFDRITGEYQIPLFSLNYEFPLFQRNIGGGKTKRRRSRRRHIKRRSNTRRRKHLRK